VCIGFASSMPPIGPGGLMLMRRGLEGRVREGLALAAGGATADAGYCAFAMIGFSVLFWKHPGVAASMRWLGVAILSGLGVWFLAHRPKQIRTDRENHVHAHWPQQMLLGFSVTAFNPTLLLTWSSAIAVLASFGGGFFSPTGRIAFPIGVGIGDVLWASIALISWRRLGRFVSARVLAIIMRGMGVGLLACAVYLAFK
jgi:threonine/homoserine/homoserine lactone efflux protein